MKKLSAKFAAVAVLLCMAASAQAQQQYSLVHGAQIDYYYNAAVYSAPTITGNLVEFNFGYSSVPGSTGISFRDDVFSVYAVAHTGYSLTGAMTLGMDGTMQWPTTSSTGGTDANARIAVTTINYVNTDPANGVQWPTQTWPEALAPVIVDITKVGQFGTSDVFSAESSSTATGSYQALQLWNVSSIETFDNRDALVSINKVRFDFGTQIAAPVPEADTYAMLAAGLLMLGVSLKRRNRKS
jgi:hypothetical protein